MNIWSEKRIIIISSIAHCHRQIMAKSIHPSILSHYYAKRPLTRSYHSYENEWKKERKMAIVVVVCKLSDNITTRRGVERRSPFYMCTVLSDQILLSSFLECRIVTLYYRDDETYILYYCCCPHIMMCHVLVHARSTNYYRIRLTDWLTVIAAHSSTSVWV